METIVYDFMQKHFSASVIFIIILVVGFGVMVWFVSYAFYKIKNLKCKEHEEDLESIKEHKLLPCENHTELLNIQKNDVIELKTSIKYLTKSIDAAIQTFQSNNNSDRFTQIHSPLKITKEGYDMVKKIGMDKMFENNWARIKQLCKGKLQSKNPYDIQQYFIELAFVSPEEFLSVEELDKVKRDAYNSGIPLFSYMKVIAVMFRDKYFEENNIDIQDVEKYEPK